MMTAPLPRRRSIPVKSWTYPARGRDKSRKADGGDGAEAGVKPERTQKKGQAKVKTAQGQPKANTHSGRGRRDYKMPWRVEKKPKPVTSGTQTSTASENVTESADKVGNDEVNNHKGDNEQVNPASESEGISSENTPRQAGSAADQEHAIPEVLSDATPAISANDGNQDNAETDDVLFDLHVPSPTLSQRMKVTLTPDTEDESILTDPVIRKREFTRRKSIIEIELGMKSPVSAPSIETPPPKPERLPLGNRKSSTLGTMSSIKKVSFGKSDEIVPDKHACADDYRVRPEARRRSSMYDPPVSNELSLSDAAKIAALSMIDDPMTSLTSRTSHPVASLLAWGSLGSRRRSIRVQNTPMYIVYNVCVHIDFHIYKLYV